MAEVAVSGNVLKWAREFRGLEIDAAAEKLKLESGDLAAIEEKEETEIALGMFEKFASAYRLPQSTLFRSTPPKQPKFPSEHRTLDGRSPKHSFEYSVALSNIRSLQLTLTNLSQDDEEFVWPRLPVYSRAETDPTQIGERERRHSDISFEDQLGWKPSKAFNYWRSYFEQKGIVVYLQKFELGDCRGFSIRDEGQPPAIVINKSEENDRARIFTLIHEYAHLVIDEPGTSDLDSRNPVEAYCNKFAAAFLMPRDALKELIGTWPNEQIEWQDSKIKFMAGRLKVSQRALALRLEELGLARKGFNQRFNWAPMKKPRRSDSGGGGDYIKTRLSELGSRYTGAIIDAMDRGTITTFDASSALGLGEQHFPAVRDYVVGRRGPLSE